MGLNRNKLYLSFLATLGAFGGVAFTVNTVLVIHDSWHHQSLPAQLRSATKKLGSWRPTHLSTGPSEDTFLTRDEVESCISAVDAAHQFAISDFVKDFRDERHPSKLTAAEFEQAQKHDEEAVVFLRKYFSETLYTFYWGSEMHRENPIQAFFLGLLAFLPAVALVLLRKWVLWLYD